ncbi:MAG: hypothetical protein IJA86_05495 [Clostridia bacterium]|nr:hypothetical protein [Clostridia bacterium]
MAKYLPISLNLEKRSVLIFGGGSKAMEKIEKLFPCAPVLTVTASKITPTIKQWKEEQKLRLVKSDFTNAQAVLDSVKPKLVIIADVQPEKIPALYTTCIRNGVEVHTVEHKEYSTFMFPVVKKQEIVSVASPTAIQKMKEQIPLYLSALSEQLTSLPKKFMSQTEFNPKSFITIYKSFLEAALRENRLLSMEEMEALAQTYIEK